MSEPDSFLSFINLHSTAALNFLCPRPPFTDTEARFISHINLIRPANVPGRLGDFASFDFLENADETLKGNTQGGD